MSFIVSRLKMERRRTVRPGPRPEYGPGYYGAFVYDLDGHKIEANVIPGAD